MSLASTADSAASVVLWRIGRH